MRKSRALKKRPLHPFPRLAHVSSLWIPPNPSSSSSIGHSLTFGARPTKQLRRLSELIEKGARVLLDMKTKRALLYDFSQGIRTICEISVRMLSSLLKKGDIAPVAQHQHIIHYASRHMDPTWYQDPDRSF